MSHSRVSPSSAHRWVHCPGSVIMSEQFPDPSGAAAAEGEACHWIASETLLGHTPGPTAPNGVIVTDEMRDAAAVYVKAVQSIAAPGLQLAVEHKLAIQRVHNGCFGTMDACCWVDPHNLHIWDLKYGFGIVEPYENWQLMCYAAGLLPQGVNDQGVTVHFHIIQPRPFHFDGPVRTWSTPADGLLRGYINRLNHAAAIALQPNPPTTSGEHCKYCSARHACPAAQKAAMFAVDYSDTSRVELLSPEALSIELRTMQRAAEAIQFRLTGLEGQARALLSGGQAVPGYALQNGVGKKQWCVPVEEVIALSDLMCINLCKSVDTITPAQAEKAGLPADIIAKFSSRGVGEAKLVATNNTLASRVFTQGE